MKSETIIGIVQRVYVIEIKGQMTLRDEGQASCPRMCLANLDKMWCHWSLWDTPEGK